MFSEEEYILSYLDALDDVVEVDDFLGIKDDCVPDGESEVLDVPSKQNDASWQGKNEGTTDEMEYQSFTDEEYNAAADIYAEENEFDAPKAAAGMESKRFTGAGYEDISFKYPTPILKGNSYEYPETRLSPGSGSGSKDQAAHYGWNPKYERRSNAPGYSSGPRNQSEMRYPEAWTNNQCENSQGTPRSTRATGELRGASVRALEGSNERDTSREDEWNCGQDGGTSLIHEEQNKVVQNLRLFRMNHNPGGSAANNSNTASHHAEKLDVKRENVKRRTSTIESDRRSRGTKSDGHLEPTEYSAILPGWQDDECSRAGKETWKPATDQRNSGNGYRASNGVMKHANNEVNDMLPAGKIEEKIQEPRLSDDDWHTDSDEKAEGDSPDHDCRRSCVRDFQENIHSPDMYTPYSKKVELNDMNEASCSKIKKVRDTKLGTTINGLGLREIHLCEIHADGSATIQQRDQMFTRWRNLEFVFDEEFPAEQILRDRWYAIGRADDCVMYVQRAKVHGSADLNGKKVKMDFLDDGFHAEIDRSQIFDIENYDEVDGIAPVAVHVHVVGLTEEGYSAEDLENLQKLWSQYEILYAIPISIKHKLRVTILDSRGRTLTVRKRGDKEVNGKPIRCSNFISQR